MAHEVGDRRADRESRESHRSVTVGLRIRDRRQWRDAWRTGRRREHALHGRDARSRPPVRIGGGGRHTASIAVTTDVAFVQDDSARHP